MCVRGEGGGGPKPSARPAIRVVIFVARLGMKSRVPRIKVASCLGPGACLCRDVGRNPEPQTFNPQPSTLTPHLTPHTTQPSSLNPQPPTLNPHPQPSTLILNPQPSVGRKRRLSFSVSPRLHLSHALRILICCRQALTQQRAATLSHTQYQLNGSGKSTPPQNRQLTVH